MSDATMEQKLRLVQQVRSRYQEDQYDLSQRERILYGRTGVGLRGTGYDDSYESFQKYLRVVFSYAGTLSMEAESEEIPLSDIACGDVFLKGGSPGHVVLVADVCENEEGQKAFLLAQGYMPAQEFHLLKNPRHDSDPWYYEQEVKYPLATPEYTFPEGSFKRLSYQR